MTENFKSIDNIIVELKDILQPIQQTKQLELRKNQYPIGFIVGNPRSGTTLFLQWLSSLGCFAYPTNILARFSYAPYIGALIQRMLFEKQFDHFNELENLTDNSNFKSDLGKSQGALAPNEFHHFFRNYIDKYFPEYLDKNEFDKVDTSGLFKDLSSIEYVFNKPFVTKGLMIQYNLYEFYKINPKCVFFQINRDPFYVMQSIYKSRKKYFDNINTWWSVKPKEYSELIKMDVFHQIAGQVYFTQKSLNSQLEKIPDKNKIIIDYEKFCSMTSTYLEEILKKYKKNGCILQPINLPIPNFKNSNVNLLSDEITDSLKNAYIYFENNH